jgi:peptide/nickel transport system permease protein
MLGARSTLVVATAALLSGALIGTILGMIGGFFGGTIDAFISRAADITIGFPMILVALLFAVTVGPRPENVVISVAAILWARFARVIRGEVVSLRQRGYVESARVSHMPTWWILLRHILPNILSTVLVLASLQMGWVIIVEASLSFLGAGIPLPEPAWGAMVADGRDHITEAWWISTMPGFFIVVTVLALNLLGDWLRDALDPTLRVS